MQLVCVLKSDSWVPPSLNLEERDNKFDSIERESYKCRVFAVIKKRIYDSFVVKTRKQNVTHRAYTCAYCGSQFDDFSKVEKYDIHILSGDTDKQFLKTHVTTCLEVLIALLQDGKLVDGVFEFDALRFWHVIVFFQLLHFVQRQTWNILWE